MLNSIITITATLTQDARIFVTANNKAVVNFSVADNDSYKSGEEWQQRTTYIECSYWRSDAIGKILRKGTDVYMTGHLQAEHYTNGDGQTVAKVRFVAQEITILNYAPRKEGKNNGEPAAGGNAGGSRSGFSRRNRKDTANAGVAAGTTNTGGADDDLPF